MTTDRRQLLQDALAAIERLEGTLEAERRARREPLAIVGAGCRYAGGVEDPEGLWRLLADGVDAVREVPRDRWDADAYYSPDPKAPGKMVARRGGFLDRIDGFDAPLFGISPREAATLDPQQRMLLETAQEALERAGIPVDGLSGSRTGVFVGITTSDYGQLLRADGVENSDVYSATGAALNAAAGRISFTFGLQGPCVSVDTACSSSLVAMHLACQSLRTGESDLALAGGVNVVLSPDAMVLFSRWGMLAPDGACKTFDAGADGFVRAEGCAVLALKRLSDAVAAGDPILALVRGSAVNSDGRSSGLTVPNGPAQEKVIRAALQSAGLAPADVDYVEAHGTGTSLGDPIELEALGAVMREGRPSDRPLRVGSIKTNIGHAEAASGLAGLLKVVLSLQHEAIPPHLHFHVPNPRIPWADLPLEVPTVLTPWPRGERPRRAGVSSFGFSGTNAHVVLEEAPPRPAEAARADGPVLVPLSARDAEALRAVAARTADQLATSPGGSLSALAHAAGVGRAHRAARAALVAASREELLRELSGLAGGEAPAGTAVGTVRAGEQPRVAFLFTGQGAQYAGMGRGLYEGEPVFRAALDRAAAVLDPLLPRPLREVLFPAEGAETPLSQTGYTQPALFALEVALAELWGAWGVTPALVLGHSVGEYAAACVAGAMSLEDGLALVAERGRLMQDLPAGGGMAAVFAAEPAVRARLAPYAGRLAVAAVNGPEETVVSGDADALAELVRGCEQGGVKTRTLEVSHAFHSHRLDPMLGALERRAAGVAFAPPRLPLVSNLTGAPFPPGTGPDAAYWRRHAREPVRFAAGVEALRAAGVTALVELGPHPTLVALAARAVPGASWASLASLRRGKEDRREIRAALGALYVRGAAVSWGAVEPAPRAPRLALPTYPFQRTRHWVKAPQAAGAPAAAAPGHPLLGERRELAGAPGTHVWEGRVSLERQGWLTDHRVQDAAIVPATAYIEMALAAAAEVLGPAVSGRPVAVWEIVNRKPLVLHEGVEWAVQATLTVQPDGAARFTVHGRPLGAPGAAALPWTEHVTARLGHAGADVEEAGALAAARARCAARQEGTAFYADLARKGNGWGPLFQGVQELWRGEGEAVARVQVPAALAGETTRYAFHPAVSDACGHALVAAAPEARGAFVGGGVGEIRFHRPPAGITLWAHARLRQAAAGERLVHGDVRVYDEAGALISETLDARLWYLDAAEGDALLGAPDAWFHEVRWQPQPELSPPLRGAASGAWLVLADRGGLAARLLAARPAAAGRTVLVERGEAWSLAGDRATARAGSAEDLRRLLEAIPGVSAVVHLWALEPGPEPLAAGPGNLLALVKALRALPAGAPRPRIWVCTRGSQAVLGGDCDDPWGAALWGMGRALAVEHAEAWGGLVDLGPAAEDGAAAPALAREIAAGTAEDKVALRGGQRYVPRLVHQARRGGVAGAFAARPDGTYLVTGGLGGIGLAMAGWLVARGARHLVLAGRSGLPPRGAWDGLDPMSPEGRRAAAVRALEAAGAVVEVAALDVAAEGPLERCLEARRVRGAPPVRGVVHAAGVLHFRALDDEDGASLAAALSAKVAGAWRLHRLLEREPLDLFVACASTSALLGSPLLGVYAAGNAFLDALAHHRRGRGLAALSVDWGTWGEVGMAVQAGKGAGNVMLAGFSTISTARGLDALGQLLAAGAVQAAVMPVDWVELARAYPGFAADPFLAELAGAGRASPAARGGAPGLTGAELRAASGAERPAAVTRYLRREAARALGMDADALDPTAPLSSLGFDSLMAVQLKNQLEADLGVVVAMIQFLRGPSVEELVPGVVAALDAASAQPGSTGEAAAVMEEGSL